MVELYTARCEYTLHVIFAEEAMHDMSMHIQM